MNDTTIETRVSEVFAEILDAKLPQDRDQLVYNEYDGWDSVAHMTLVTALEEKFDCMLDVDDILDMSSFDKSIQIMAKYA